MSIKKIAIFLSIICLFSQTHTEELDPEYNYDQFMKHFGREYTGEEKLKHEQIFNKNYLDLMKRRQNGQDVVVNDFLDWDSEQKQSFMNYRPQKLNVPLSTRPLKSSSLFASPTSFDWRTLGRVTSIKNQGNCGSCWSFSSTAAYQSALAIQTNGTLYDLSQQYALQCDTGSSGCNGGYPYSAFSLYNTTGIPLQQKYPYQQNSTYYSQNNICNNTYNKQNNNNIKLNSTILSIQHYSNLTTQQIQQDLVTYGPLPVAIFASNSAFLYVGPTGLVDKCPIGNIDHAILLVGYNSTHWFVKNSWGTAWGDNGFAYILKVNDCNLRLWVDVLAVNYPFLPTPSPSPTPTPTVGYTTLTISMTDSGNNGWQGTIISLMQNGVIIANFGNTFLTGNKSNPVYFSNIRNQTQTNIIVTKIGNNSNQIAFNIYNIQNTLIFSYNTNIQLTNLTNNNSILGTICPTYGCTAPTLLPYYITLTDSYGDGWNGNSIGVRQNNSITYFGYTFTTGSTYGPFFVNLAPNLNVDVIVYTLGSKTQQVGLTIRTYHGFIVFQRLPGKRFYSNSLLGSFMPTALNFVPANLNIQDNTNTNNNNNNNNNNQLALTQTNIGKILIATITIAITQFIILIIFILATFKVYRMLKINNYNKNMENNAKNNNVVYTEACINDNKNNNNSETMSIPSSATIINVERI